jgi:DNA-directed RNA polymerase subunit RPC12/RpoP
MLLKRAEADKHGFTPYECSLCGTHFDSSGGTPPLTCPICNDGKPLVDETNPYLARTKEPRRFVVTLLAEVAARSPHEAEDVAMAWCARVRLTKRVTLISVADGMTEEM